MQHRSSHGFELHDTSRVARRAQTCGFASARRSVLMLLAFLACASIQLVAHTRVMAVEAPRSSHGGPAASERSRDVWLASFLSSSAQCRSHEDATPDNELSAVEAEDSEEIAGLHAARVCVATQFAPIGPRVGERPPVAHAAWLQPSLASSALPRGPP